MTATILQQLSGLPRLEAVKIIIAALQEVTAGMKGEDLPGIIPVIQKLVPVKKRKHDPYTAVWEYLETVKEYETGLELRKSLVARFGEAGTPSQSMLYRYLKNRGTK
jgi:hypothetical protein